MTEGKKKENGFLAVMVRFFLLFCTILTCPALIVDWTGGGAARSISSSDEGDYPPIPGMPIPGVSGGSEDAPPPLDEKDLEKWTRIAHPRAARSKSPDELDQFIQEVMATSKRIDALEREKLKDNPGYVYVPKFDVYIGLAAYNAFKASFGKAPDEFDIVPVRDTKGKQFVDNRSQEACFALEPAAERWEQLNQAYHKRTGGQVQPDSCMRSKGRQLATKTAQVISCANTQSPSDEEIKRCMHETRQTSAPHLTGDHVWGVAFDSRLARTKAKKEAKAAGFFGGCRSTIALSDKDHQSLLLTKKGGKGTWAVCQVQVGLGSVKKGAKKLWKKITS